MTNIEDRLLNWAVPEWFAWTTLPAVLGAVLFLGATGPGASPRRLPGRLEWLTALGILALGVATFVGTRSLAADTRDFEARAFGYGSIAQLTPSPRGWREVELPLLDKCRTRIEDFGGPVLQLWHREASAGGRLQVTYLLDGRALAFPGALATRLTQVGPGRDPASVALALHRTTRAREVNRLLDILEAHDVAEVALVYQLPARAIATRTLGELPPNPQLCVLLQSASARLNPNELWVDWLRRRLREGLPAPTLAPTREGKP